jgi:hypothetical protein
MTPEEKLAGDTLSVAIWERIRSAVAPLHPTEIRTSQSQIGFYRSHPYAALWRPGQYLRHTKVPLVLSVYTRHRLPSRRWKQVFSPQPRRFTHHVELEGPDDVDDEVAAWLAEAWREAA